MPKLRIGFSTDFNLKDEQVGIGTELPTARLEVASNILAQNILDSGGISTITRYDGFLNPDLILTERTTSLSITDKGNLNTLSGEIKIEGEVTVEEGTPLAGGRLDSLTVTGKFDLPQGGSEDREDTPEKGSTRFNEDLGQLEFYTGLEWRTVGSYDGSGRGRGVFGGGFPGTVSQNKTRLDYIQIHTLGNSIFFGDLTLGRRNPGGRVSSSTRGIIHGGYTDGAPINTDTIDYFTIASGGNAADFGNLLSNTHAIANGGVSSSTRGIMAGGETSTIQNVIQYVQIHTTGNALDFGDLSKSAINLQAVGSSTRGVLTGGYSSPGTSNISMEFITISSLGDTVLFGDLTHGRYYGGCVSNGTRGVIAGGEIIGSPVFTHTDVVDYITISTTGNALDFGNLSAARSRTASVETSVRGVFVGSVSPGSSSTFTNVMDYITISSTGDAQDFGDITNGGIFQIAGCSDSHGGLGGF